MALPRCSLSAFLAHTKAQLQHAVRHGQQITFVVGNQSADLDSFTSALLFAYLRSLHPPKAAFTPLYTPLLNLHREDLHIRPEFLAVFRHAGIDSQHLLTLDDLWESPKSARDDQSRVSKLPFAPGTTHWILTDHNKPDGELPGHFDLTVSGVVDHHEDEDFVPQDTAPEPRIIEKCGSCTSLVIRYLEDSWPTIVAQASDISIEGGTGQGTRGQDDVSPNAKESNANIELWDAQLAQLALASILIDTANLKNEDKIEHSDREAVKFLESKIKQLRSKDSPPWNRKTFYKEINAAKKNLENIDFHSLLRKDYKQWTEEGIVVGISSVPAPTSALIPKARECLQDSVLAESKPDAQDETVLREAIKQYQLKRGIDVYALMTAFKDPKTKARRRELLIQTLNSTDRTNGLLTKFEVDGKGKGEFGLEHKTLTGDGVNVGDTFLGAGDGDQTKHGIKEMKLWNQGDVSKSRKQIAPFLRKVVRELTNVK